jgi:hypothetical protein
VTGGIIPNRPIGDAPKDGRVIVVGAVACGEYEMAWNPAAENPLWAPDVTGMWESADRTFTWAYYEGGGPEYWRPCDGCTLPVPPRPRLGRN